MSQFNVIFNGLKTFNAEFNGTEAFDFAISNENVFDISFKNSIATDVEFNGNTEFTADMTTVVTIVPNPYEGQYVVTPMLFQQTILPTTGKNLVHDVTVEEIPYWETDNPSGGTTVYIAMGV